MWQERLLSQIDGSSRVRVLHAETGAGKTHLAAEWARRRQARGLPTAWVLVDQDSRESAAFWRRVAVAVGAVVSQQAGLMLEAAVARELPAKSTIAAVSAALVTAPESVALVVDGLHALPMAVQREFVSFLERTPWVGALVTTRSQTALERPATRASLAITVLNSRELALRSDEIVDLGRSVQIEVSHLEAAEVYRLTRGSAVAVRVVLEQFRVDVNDSAEPRPRTRRRREQALAAAATDQLEAIESETERQMARRLALSPELDGSLAAEITGMPEAWALVEAWEQQGLGRIETESQARPVFTFYALPLAGLREEGRQTLTSEECRRINILAARRLAGSGDPVDVLRLLIEAGLDRSVWGQFVRRFSEIGPDRRDEVLDLLYALPRERFEREGALAMVLAALVGGTALRHSGRTERLIRGGLGELQSRTVASEPTDRFLIQLACFAGHRALREYSKANVIARRILRPTVDLETSVNSRPGRSRSFVIDFITVHILAGDLEAAVEAAAALTDEAYPALIAQRSALHALCHALNGDIRAAGLAAEHAVGLPPAEYTGTPVGSARQLARVHLLLEQGAVLDAFLELDGLREGAAADEFWPIILWTSAYTRLVTGGAERGAVELDRAVDGLSYAVLAPAWEERLRALRADLHLASGAAGRAAEAIDGPAETASVLGAIVRISLVVSKPDEARARLTTLSTMKLSPREAAEYHLLNASAQQRLGRTEVAEHALDQALHLIRETRLRSLLSFIAAEDLAALRPLALPALWLEPLAQPFSMTTLVGALTDREALVLAELAVGDQIAQIADRLHVSPNTVKSQLRSVYRKLGVSGREGALRSAVEHGLL